MTKDVQHDRSASPLASVSEEIYAPPPTPKPHGLGDDARHPPEPEPTAAFDIESFEGFGSFG